MRKMLKVLAAIFAAVVMAIPMVACGDSSKTQSELDLLKETIEELTDRLDDLTAENGELTDKNAELTDRLDELATANGELADKNEELSDRIDALNVFTTDKAEYNERETMTVYFKNVPVLKIRGDFDNRHGTLLYGGFNFDLYITSLCGNLLAESITGTIRLDWDNGSCFRKPSTSTAVLKQNKETSAGGYFDDTEEAYANGTWFDLVICVPGTPFELARFKNVSYTW